METIHTDRAPKAIGPYSQAVRAGGFLFVSGQIALKPETGDIDGTDIETQTRRVLSNVRAVIEAAGLGMKNIVKTTVYLADIAEFPKFNAVYESMLDGHRPARATIQAAALPRGARVELDVVAADERGH